MKKILAILLAALMSIALFAGCAGQPGESSGSTSSPPEDSSVPYKGVLMMATTTSTDNTGLLDFLAPVFREDTGWELQWLSVGTGEALQLGMDGQVDVVLVHARAREDAFVADGYGVERFDVMYNDFVIVGPPDGPVTRTGDVRAAFSQILDESLVFISRGDDSGTHTTERNVWSALGLNGEGNPNYVSAGAGMSATIIMADEMLGYTLADRGTWLSTKRNADNNIELEIICEGDSSLLNPYGVIAVSPDMYPEVNNEAASAFIEWIISAEIQALIGQFGVEDFGEPLFTPSA